jgi:hypothetical protein
MNERSNRAAVHGPHFWWLRPLSSIKEAAMPRLGRDGAWLALAGLWSLNGPAESLLMRHHGAPAYACAKAVAVGASYVLFAPVPVPEALAVFRHPLMWVLFAVSLFNTPLNAHIIRHGDPAVQLPLAQVVSQLLRALWWAVLLGRPLAPRQCVGIALAAASCACLT